MLMARRPFGRLLRRIPGGLVRLLAVVVAFASLLPARPAAAADARSDQVILFMGRDFTGPSKTWSLKPDQPFLAVPYTGDEFRPVSASIKLGADVGVLLFEHPFFSTTDETCDYQLGSEADPQLWWLSAKAMVAPGAQEPGAVEANLRPQEIASLILYRRALGPPPGALLLERRRYVDWECPAPTKARGYRRLFVPVAAPPHREGCFNLEAALSYGASGTAALDFSAASELLLLLPRDLGADYAAIDHRFTVALHRDKDCEGEPTSFSQAGSGARRFELKAFGLDRKARSVMIRYDEGAYDAVPLAASQGSGVAGETATETPAETLAEETQAATPNEPPAPAMSEPAAEPVAAAPPEAVEAAPEPVATTTPEAAVPAATSADTISPAETASPEATGPAADATGTATEPASQAATQTAEQSGSAAAASSVSSGAASAAVPNEATGESEPAASIGGLAPAAGGAATTETPAAEEPATAGPVAAAPAPSEAGPETPEPAETPESAPPPAGTTGFLVLPENQPDAADARQTFKFPLLQGYRLSACLYQQEDCGEPAASEWCKARGFAGGAAAFEIDENIGSLFPTLALGDLQLCANFVCDGFKEITCLP
jgi:hypothetical protein